MQTEEMLMSQKSLSIDIRTLFSFWQSRKVPSEVPRCPEHVLLRQKVCCEKQNAVRLRTVLHGVVTPASVRGCLANWGLRWSEHALWSVRGTLFVRYEVGESSP